MDEISVVVRIYPSGEELDVELPLYSTGKDIIDELLNANLGIPKTDAQGNQYFYELFCKDISKTIVPEKTLADLGVQSGYRLLLTPKLVAGIQ